MKKDITRLFCLVDDFLKALEKERKKKQIEDGKKPKKPTRTPWINRKRSSDYSVDVSRISMPKF